MLINIYEVGPRDGLQSLPSLATEIKIDLINRLALTGIKKMMLHSVSLFQTTNITRNSGMQIKMVK